MPRLEQPRAEVRLGPHYKAIRAQNYRVQDT
jgi:hypothetical protein